MRGPAAALVLGMVLPLSACSGGGGGGGGGRTSAGVLPQDLKVLAVNAHRRDDWPRNAALEIRFSAALSKASLRPGTVEDAIRIGVVTPKGRIPARGTYAFAVEGGRVRRDRVIFDPTRSPAGSPDCTDRPFGFDAFTTYEVVVPHPPAATRFVTARGGKPPVETFETFFTTRNSYLRDAVPPVRTDFGAGEPLSFAPPRLLTGEIPHDARVSLSFSEAIDPVSVEHGTTIFVRNETLSSAAGVPILVPGSFESDPCSRTWTFVPAFSFGGDGYEISVTTTTGIRDLAGNPLGNPGTASFRTAVEAGVPTVLAISESFDGPSTMDPAATTADWGVTQPGVLLGGAVTSAVVSVSLQPSQVPGGTRRTVRDQPFWDASSPRAGSVGHDQFLYTQAELGGPGAITQVGWGPSSNALFASDHGRVKVVLGHSGGTSLSLNLANNFDAGTPVKVADASYSIPQRATIDPPCGVDACAAGYWPLPAFAQPFEYDGKSSLVVDVDASVGTNYQIMRILFGPPAFPLRHAFGATGSGTGLFAEPAVYDMQFVKKRRTTVARSLFYDTGPGSRDYGPPIPTPGFQVAGTSLSIELEGADGMSFPVPGNPLNQVPDPSTFTGWSTSADAIDGKRFVRFRVTLVGNVTTGQVPRLSGLLIPFVP